jgi:Apea-like HEPN
MDERFIHDVRSGSIENGRADAEAKSRFRAAVSRWIETFLTRQTEDNVTTQKREIWVRGDQPGSMITAESRSVFWTRYTDNDATCEDEWLVVEAAAREWDTLASHLGKLIGSDGSGRFRVDLGQLLLPLLPQPTWDPLSESIVLPKFDSVSFSHQFERLSVFLESASLAYFTRTVLVGVHIADSLLPMRLSDSMSLERLSLEQAQVFGHFGLLQSPSGNPRGPYAYPNDPIVAFTWQRELSKRFGAFEEDAVRDLVVRNEFERVHDALLQAVALLGYGTAIIGGSMTFLSGWEVGGISFNRPRSEVPQTPPGITKRIEITEDQISVLRNLFNKILDRKHEDGLNTALRRLTYAMERKRPQDRLLDSMIAAEAVFGADATTEMTYRISLRVAFATEEEDIEKRRHVFNLMKNAYAVRSKVVHGDEPKQTNMKINGEIVSLSCFVVYVEDIIRRAVRTVLERTDGQFNAAPWDAIILGLRSSIPND